MHPLPPAATVKSWANKFILYFFMALGAFVAAFAIDVFLIPNNLIDGGTVGLAMICSKVTSQQYLPFFLVLINFPFVILAYKFIGKTFVVHMIFAVVAFAGSLIFIQNFIPWKFS